MESVWVFNGASEPFPSAVFSTRERAESWNCQNKLEGTLTKYPVDVSVYDFAIQSGWFTPKRDYQHSSKFIQRFTSASLEHHHYEDGVTPS